MTHFFCTMRLVPYERNDATFNTFIRGFYKKTYFFEFFDYVFQGVPDLFLQKMTEKFDPFYIGKDGEKTCQKMSKIL